MAQPLAAGTIPRTSTCTTSFFIRTVYCVLPKKQDANGRAMLHHPSRSSLQNQLLNCSSACGKSIWFHEAQTVHHVAAASRCVFCGSDRQADAGTSEASPCACHSAN